MLQITAFFKRCALIQEIPIFSRRNWLDIHRIATHAHLRHYKKGQIVYRHGEQPSDFFCVISGRIQGYTLDDAGNKIDVEFFRRGMYFGIVSLLTGKPHSMTMAAVNDSTVLRIEKDDFHSLLKSIPQLGVEFSQNLSQRIHQRIAKKRSLDQHVILAVYGPTRGAGSSTYAFHLALALKQQTHHEVVFVRIGPPTQAASASLDPEHMAGASPQWIAPGLNMETLLRGPDRLQQSIIRSDLGISLLNVEVTADHMNLVSHISEFVTTLIMEYTFVILDLPTEIDRLILKTLTQSDHIHLIARDRPDELRAIQEVLTSLEEQQREKFDPERVKVLISGQPTAPDMNRSQIHEIIDYDIYKRLSHIDPRDLTSEQECHHALRVAIPPETSRFAHDVRRIAREIGGVQVGLVLGGGAALGIAHIGILQVFEREHIPLDIVAGSSMGALIASLWASGYTANDLASIAGQFRDQRSLLKLFDPVIPVSGVMGGRFIKRWLGRYLSNRSFEETWLPLKIVAYDLMSRQELVYNDGDLLSAVRKSISIPGIFEPVLEDDRVIIDGGVLNPVPANVLRAEGINRIIAVNVLQSPAEVVRGIETRKTLMESQQRVPFHESPMGFLKYRLARGIQRHSKPTISNIMVRTLLATEYELAERSMQHVDIAIHPDLTGINWYELYRVDDLIARGVEAAEKALPDIRALAGAHDPAPHP